MNYMDTSNVYGPSQKNFGDAFRRLGLSPSAANYDSVARGQIFVATKTHIRTARRPEGERFRTDFSEGMLDDFHVSTAVEDVRRSLSLMFGDGKGGYPDGAYLDSVQFHNINTMDEIDMLFEGFDDQRPSETGWARSRRCSTSGRVRTRPAVIQGRKSSSATSALPDIGTRQHIFTRSSGTVAASSIPCW